ncbi:dynamin family protein [Lactococcus formosensis]|uniref:dynamin family protein n=1 Tax=Lactococcus formosensis TaxID=1281486 RepID=UPI002435C728|nr:dynamin family protein [Lactococcus formosensis]MDG6163307.1 dynamin family protein [Lactococcus formosensis]
MALDLSNLKVLRERSGMTQEDIANKLGTTKGSISNWEANPQNLSIDKLNQYLEIVGAKLSDFEEKEKGKTMKIDVNTDIIKFRSDLITTIKELNNSKADQGSSVPLDTVFETTMTDLEKLQVESRKARILIVGPSDAGKSTFINKLLGETIVPSHWTPATSMAIKIIHSSEKPEWVTGNTLIVKNDLKVDKAPAEPFNLRDRKYFNEHVQLEGGREILQEYGEREGDKYNSKSADEEMIFTYVDSEILNVIDIYDTPGTAAGEDDASEIDEQISADMRNNADAVIYLMTANQFLHRQDFQLLRRDIERLPQVFDGKNGLGKLANLFVVASQADIIDTEEDRKRILASGAKRFSKTLTPEFFERLGCTQEDLSKRFFTISNKAGHEDISADFENDFEAFIKNTQDIILNNSVNKRDQFVRFHIYEIDKGISKVKKDKLSHDKLVEEFKEKEVYLPKILKANAEFADNIRKELSQSKAAAKAKFEVYYKQVLNQSNLLQEIEMGGYKNKKDDKEVFANKISNQLSDKYKEIIDEESSKFEEKLKRAAEKIQVSANIPTVFFDFKAATLGLVASGVTAGAFAVVAAGITSNLGLYILVAQVGGLLTSAGIISSPIVATAAVSALGGPVTWVVGISALIGTAIYGIFHRNAWKGKLAKTLIEGYENKNALGQYFDGIDTFIKDTEHGVDDLKKGLDIAANEDVKLSKLRAKANPEEFEKEIKQLQSFKSSFESATSKY